MGFWLKSFNAQPAPVPGVSYTVAQINLCASCWTLGGSWNELTWLGLAVPLPSTAIFVVAALSWAWISDGPLKGRRWPFIYLGAGIDVSRFSVSSGVEARAELVSLRPRS